jgi:hypothetical protein
MILTKYNLKLPLQKVSQCSGSKMYWFRLFNVRNLVSAGILANTSIAQQLIHTDPYTYNGAQELQSKVRDNYSVSKDESIRTAICILI